MGRMCKKTSMWGEQAPWHTCSLEDQELGEVINKWLIAGFCGLQEDTTCTDGRGSAVGA